MLSSASCPDIVAKSTTWPAKTVKSNLDCCPVTAVYVITYQPFKAYVVVVDIFQELLNVP
jgi:hypothetical protein